MYNHIYDEFIENQLDIQKTWKKYKNEIPDIKDFITIIASHEFEEYLTTKAGLEYAFSKYKFFKANNIIIDELVKELKKGDMKTSEKMQLFGKIVSFINSLETYERDELKANMPPLASLNLDIQ